MMIKYCSSTLQHYNPFSTLSNFLNRLTCKVFSSKMDQSLHISNSLRAESTIRSLDRILLLFDHSFYHYFESAFSYLQHQNSKQALDHLDCMCLGKVPVLIS